MSTTDLGKIGIAVKGNYDSTVAYERNDVVYLVGDSYIAKQNVPAGTIPTNTTYWAKLVDGFSRNVDAMPYSWWGIGGSSSAGYAKMATLRITGTYVTGPFQFVVLREGDNTEVTLTLEFTYGNTTDPTISSFTYDKTPTPYGTYTEFGAFAYKSATSTWEIYVRKPSGSAYVQSTTYMMGQLNSKVSLTYGDAIKTSIPSGATSAILATPYSPTPTFTQDSGTSSISMKSFAQCGNVCQLSLGFSLQSANLGDIMLQGTFSGIAMPTTNAFCTIVHTQGSVFTARLTASGTFTLRVGGANYTAPSGGGTNYATLIYLTNG